MSLNYSQLPYLKAAGFSGDALRKAWAISMRESGGRPDAYNGDTGTGDQSYGMFQINMLGNLGPARRKQYGLKSNEDLYDPATNARVAYQMSKGGTDFGAWAIGPNAYKGAPSNASAKFTALYNQWNPPGGSESGGAVPPKTQRQVQQAGGSRNRKLAAMGLLEQVLNRHGDQNSSVMSLFGALQRRMQDTEAEGPKTPTAPEMPSVSPPQNAPTANPGDSGHLPTNGGGGWKGIDTDGFTDDFDSRLSALMKASGGRLSITSGYRSADYQQKLYAEAVRKYGSEQAARKWVAPPGRSNHGRGTAADLGGDLAWAHANAGRFGLRFPMSWENWHIEPINT